MVYAKTDLYNELRPLCYQRHFRNNQRKTSDIDEVQPLNSDSMAGVRTSHSYSSSEAGVRIKLGVWCGHQPQSGKVFR